MVNNSSRVIIYIHTIIHTLAILVSQLHFAEGSTSCHVITNAKISVYPTRSSFQRKDLCFPCANSVFWEI